MHKDLIEFNKARRTKAYPSLHSGDVVKIHRRIVEGGKERTQVFQGMVIGMKGGQSSSPTVTVRKMSFGVGVELILPLLSQSIEKIEVLKSTRSRRAKLYYVRDKSAKLLSKKLKEVSLKTKKGGIEEILAEEVEESVAEVKAEEAVSEESVQAEEAPKA